MFVPANIQEPIDKAFGRSVYLRVIIIGLQIAWASIIGIILRILGRIQKYLHKLV